MQINKAGYNFRHPAGFMIDRPHGSGDYLLLLFKSPAFAVLHGRRERLAPGSALLYQKGTAQLYGGRPGGEFVNDWVHFEIEDTTAFAAFAALGIPADTPLVLRDADEISAALRDLVSERHAQSKHREESSVCRLWLLLYKIADQISGKDPAREHPLYSRFCALRGEIRAEPQREWRIDEICKDLMFSRSRVQHLYKQFFGRSISEEIRRGRMEYARYLLSTTDLPVGQIARACGYESDVHFMRLFKETLGVTPTAYRRTSARRPPAKNV